MLYIIFYFLLKLNAKKADHDNQNIHLILESSDVGKNKNEFDEKCIEKVGITSSIKERKIYQKRSKHMVGFGIESASNVVYEEETSAAASGSNDNMIKKSYNSPSIFGSLNLVNINKYSCSAFAVYRFKNFGYYNGKIALQVSRRFFKSTLGAFVSYDFTTCTINISNTRKRRKIGFGLCFVQLLRYGLRLTIIANLNILDISSYNSKYKLAKTNNGELEYSILIFLSKTI